jgi:hypothetical protein
MKARVGSLVAALALTAGLFAVPAIHCGACDGASGFVLNAGMACCTPACSASEVRSPEALLGATGSLEAPPAAGWAPAAAAAAVMGAPARSAAGLSPLDTGPRSPSLLLLLLQLRI